MPWSGVKRPPDDVINSWGNPYLRAYMLAHPERVLKNYEYFIWIGKMQRLWAEECGVNGYRAVLSEERFTEWLSEHALHEDTLPISCAKCKEVTTEGRAKKEWFKRMPECDYVCFECRKC